jgi:hypothetical protein
MARSSTIASLRSRIHRSRPLLSSRYLLAITRRTIHSDPYIERAVQGSARNGEVLDPKLLKYLSPLGWEHINLTGDYQWKGKRPAQGRFRPLRTPSHP